MQENPENNATTPRHHGPVMVYIEQRHSQVQPVAFELLGKARSLADAAGARVVAFLPGADVAGLAPDLIAAGADTVLLVSDPCLEPYTTEPYAQATAQAIAHVAPDIVLFPATGVGRDLAPRLSARLRTGLTADCTALDMGPDGNLLMTRPAFGGNLMATIVCPDHRPQMSTVRPGVMRRMAPDPARKGTIEEFRPRFDPSRFRVRVVEEVREERAVADITQARILVSGGRGVGTGDGFSKLQALAGALGAEVSASRAMVDNGLMPHDRQVGQTGKTVRPELYMALGISGAIQHLAGMEESDYIIAVNKDRYAPIFSVADLGIVGDLHQIVPLLTQALEQRK